MLSGGAAPHDPQVGGVVITVPVGCKIMLEAGVRLLSLANQLVHCGKSVQINFEEGDGGAMGYLDRMGFFDHLSQEVTVIPFRPVISGAHTHHGGNSGVVEIARVSHEKVDADLPDRLARAVRASCGKRNDIDRLEHAAGFIFSELINNIEEHSGATLDGYAALQVYKGGNKLVVAVSDSGKGIMDTLRPSLKFRHPRLAAMTDADLLVEIFKNGVSRFGSERGLGLRGCALKASRFRASLDVRLPNGRVALDPGGEGYTLATCYSGLPTIWGTHISFHFALT